MRKRVSHLTALLVVLSLAFTWGPLTRRTAGRIIAKDPRFAHGIKLNWNKEAVRADRVLIKVTGVSTHQKQGIGIAFVEFVWRFADEQETQTGQATFQKWDDGWRVSYFTGPRLPVR
jgi:hypothetical protein